MASAADATKFAAELVEENRREQKLNENERIHLHIACCPKEPVDLCRPRRSRRAQRLPPHGIKSGAVRDGRLRRSDESLARNKSATFGSIPNGQRITDGSGGPKEFRPSERAEPAPS